MERKYHVVKEGDSLSSIHLEYGVTETKLSEYNPSITNFVGGTITGTWTSDQGVESDWSITEVSEGHWTDDGNDRTYTQSQIEEIPGQSSQSNVVYDAGTPATGLTAGDRVWVEGVVEYIEILEYGTDVFGLTTDPSNTYTTTVYAGSEETRTEVENIISSISHISDKAMKLLSTGWVMSDGGHTIITEPDHQLNYGINDYIKINSYLMYRKA